MSASAATPCSVLFSTMKKLGGISYKELAGLILSGKPLSDGKSPVSRINDRTWVSRFIVHAPAGSLQDKYFCDFGIGALRVVSRLRSKEGRGLTSEQVLDLVCGPEGSSMVDALKACRQDVSLYRNIVTRLVKGGRFTVDERAEIAMVLFLTAGCTADVQRAAQTALDFSQSVHGARLATPATASPIEAQGERDAAGLPEPLLHLQLLRIVDGYVAGGPYWIPPTREGSEIGALRWPSGTRPSPTSAPASRPIICASGATGRARGSPRASVRATAAFCAAAPRSSSPSSSRRAMSARVSSRLLSRSARAMSCSSPTTPCSSSWRACPLIAERGCARVLPYIPSLW